jgi:hypothetical protein
MVGATVGLSNRFFWTTLFSLNSTNPKSSRAHISEVYMFELRFIPSDRCLRKLERNKYVGYADSARILERYGVIINAATVFAGKTNSARQLPFPPVATGITAQR